MLFFPAQVPETYAYTLSVALASGLPIVASALGALPERLAGVARGDGAVGRGRRRNGTRRCSPLRGERAGARGVAGEGRRAASRAS